MAFDGDATLTFQVHVVKGLFNKVPFRHGIGSLKQAIGEGALPVIDVCDDTKVTDSFHGAQIYDDSPRRVGKYRYCQNAKTRTWLTFELSGSIGRFNLPNPHGMSSIFLLLRLISLGGFSLLSGLLTAQVLEVGPGKTYPSLQAAAAATQPGDTILLFPHNWSGGIFIGNLQGTANAWITIRGEGTEPVTITGGTNAIQFSNPAFLRLENLRVRQQTGNGLNIDDGGDYDTPAKHIHLRQCVFEDMAVSGNNDLLKMSGVDSFLVEDCLFRNGAAGGSGIDMVGCHWGVIRNNDFENLGSNSIQAKGGTRYLRIHGNTFVNGGQRTLNLGGSTAAAFFRPPGANYEAADLDVYANTFTGSWAAIAYVGSQRVRVWNNTIFQPQNWVIRILQESPDTSFYQVVSHGEFVNNIVVITSSLSTTANVGPNTNAASFTFAHNLWYHRDQPQWSGPFLPAPQTASLIQVDPQLTDPQNGIFQLQSNSPAIGMGASLPDSTWQDMTGMAFLHPPSIGAWEGGVVSQLTPAPPLLTSVLFPNPADQEVFIRGKVPERFTLYDLSGTPVLMLIHPPEGAIRLPQLPAGAYLTILDYDGSQHREWLVISR